MELERVMNHCGEEVLVKAIHPEGEVAEDADAEGGDSAGDSGLLYPSALRAALQGCEEGECGPAWGLLGEGPLNQPIPGDDRISPTQLARSAASRMNHRRGRRQSMRRLGPYSQFGGGGEAQVAPGTRGEKALGYEMLEGM